MTCATLHPIKETRTRTFCILSIVDGLKSIPIYPTLLKVRYVEYDLIISWQTLLLHLLSVQVYGKHSYYTCSLCKFMANTPSTLALCTSFMAGTPTTLALRISSFTFQIACGPLMFIFSFCVPWHLGVVHFLIDQY